MDNALKLLLDSYNISTNEDYENALREIIQYLSLLGLWRSKFFEYAAFYGGTALRMFYGLRRYSEDIDFSLIKPDSEFDITPFLNSIQNELAGFGFNMQVLPGKKTTNIESAFIKGNTIQNLLAIETPDLILTKLPKNKVLKVRFELDTEPPEHASYQVKTLLIPFPFQVKLFSLSDLFAGKMHAVLCRKWKHRIKGRDFYDMLWYIGKGVECNLKHLQARMEQTNDWQNNKILNIRDVQELLYERFIKINFDIAKDDITPFINDMAEISLWSRDFFIEIIAEIKFLEADSENT